MFCSKRKKRTKCAPNSCESRVFTRKLWTYTTNICRLVIRRTKEAKGTVNQVVKYRKKAAREYKGIFELRVHSAICRACFPIFTLAGSRGAATDGRVADAAAKGHIYIRRRKHTARAARRDDAVPRMRNAKRVFSRWGFLSGDRCGIDRLGLLCPAE